MAFLFVDEQYTQNSITLNGIEDIAAQKGCKLIAKTIARWGATVRHIKMDTEVNIIRYEPLQQGPTRHERGDVTHKVRIYGSDRYGYDFVVCIEDYDGLKEALKRFGQILKRTKGKVNLIQIDELKTAPDKAQ